MRYPEHEVHSDRVGRSWGLLGGFTMVDPVDLKLSSSIALRRTISLSKFRSERTPSTNLGDLDRTTSPKVRGSMNDGWCVERSIRSKPQLVIRLG